MTPRFKSQRSSAVNSGSATRELPVLFHLMDISRPRREPAIEAELPVSAVAVESPLERESERGGEREKLISSEVPGEATSHSVLSTEYPVPSTELTGETPTATAAADVEAQVVPDHQIAPSPALPLSSSPPLGSNPFAATPPAESPVAAPAPRPRAAESRRKFKTPVVEDWFQAHGKFIVLGFVVALIAVVYFARANRQARPIAAVPSETPPLAIARAPAAEPPLAQPSTKSADLLPADDLGGEAAVTKLSAASRPVSPAAVESKVESKAELHPPTIPQLAADPPAADKPAADDELFKFTKKSEPRVAVRTDGPVTIINPLVTPRTESAAPPAPATPYLPPAGTTYPLAGAAPTIPATPPVVPVGSAGMGSQYQPQAPAPGPSPPPAWTPSPTSSGMSSPYLPQDQSAPGLRYERTGSGLY